MSVKQIFLMELDHERRMAMRAVADAPSHYWVELRPVKRTDPQSRRFHAMCEDFARSGIKWNGKPRTKDEWKVLLISGHSVATGRGAEVVAGLEGELVNVREETSKMSVSRGASLITYTQAMGDQMGVRWSDPVEEEA